LATFSHIHRHADSIPSSSRGRSIAPPTFGENDFTVSMDVFIAITKPVGIFGLYGGFLLT
ncbi:hypothetical protein, partial [Burkholderia cenocepacia]|uniref:hypothetical protein n=1 Tax=Burkholderia cenocepacia TaxID=95486 RepID=UPI00222FFE48